MTWSSIKPNTVKSTESKFQRYTALEGLVLDLQVVLADLQGSQDLLLNIVSLLQGLEVSPLELQSLVKRSEMI